MAIGKIRNKKKKKNHNSKKTHNSNKTHNSKKTTTTKKTQQQQENHPQQHESEQKQNMDKKKVQPTPYHHQQSNQAVNYLTRRLHPNIFHPLRQTVLTYKMNPPQTTVRLPLL